MTRSSEPPPTRDQLLAMAYVDDQLDRDTRADFEHRLASERDLALEVTALRRLELIARTAAPPEPIELEWRRLEAEPLQQASVTLGWVATVIGALGLAGFLLFTLIETRMPLIEKVSLGLLLGGLLAVFLTTARRRWRSRPFDPYTSVKR